MLLPSLYLTFAVTGQPLGRPQDPRSWTSTARGHPPSGPRILALGLPSRKLLAMALKGGPGRPPAPAGARRPLPATAGHCRPLPATADHCRPPPATVGGRSPPFVGDIRAFRVGPRLSWLPGPPPQGLWTRQGTFPIAPPVPRNARRRKLDLRKDPVLVMEFLKPGGSGGEKNPAPSRPWAGTSPPVVPFRNHRSGPGNLTSPRCLRPRRVGPACVPSHPELPLVSRASDRLHRSLRFCLIRCAPLLTVPSPDSDTLKVVLSRETREGALPCLFGTVILMGLMDGYGKGLRTMWIPVHSFAACLPTEGLRAEKLSAATTAEVATCQAS